MAGHYHQTENEEDYVVIQRESEQQRLSTEDYIDDRDEREDNKEERMVTEDLDAEEEARLIREEEEMLAQEGERSESSEKSYANGAPPQEEKHSLEEK